MLPQADLWSRFAVRSGVHVYRGVNRDIDIAVTAKAIGFTGESTVLDSDAVLTLGI